ncbi:ABC transporter ATP-binding protein [Tissierella pigra]|uniref:ABC transporter ATP-binding protein n=1 Tax=Tissierella pigra TaxID=2607614 RepID=A0A6N7XWJ9_9FIRM|nr:ABC transporter ATP-binding protein [Tissierella pigra]MBU5425594.1 ABC transporter ATP-binding protein [Tissierella pigra]MSU00855.1 ABC transporter ATP-binding protein [Tissierella pigra]
MSNLAIKVSNFTKTYGDFIAVDGISFEVNKGEIFGILGPNGAGKTSTLECLEGLRIPDGGTIDIMGIDPSKNSKELKNLIGVQLQSSGLPSTITVKEAMQLFSAYHNVQPRYDLIKRMDLWDKLNIQYSQLSGGQQKRLLIALAVCHNPQILILDEPTAALDVESRVELHTLMKELKSQGTTIVLATHDMAEAEKMADRIAILLKGKIMIIDTPKKIVASGSSKTKISVRTVGTSLVDLTDIVVDEYYVFYSDKPGTKVMELMNVIEEKGDSLIDLRVERPSLEERFLEITSIGGIQ